MFTKVESETIIDDPKEYVIDKCLYNQINFVYFIFMNDHPLAMLNDESIAETSAYVI